METPDGSRHFVDAPEVARTAERGVTLTITAEEVRQLPPPDKGPGARRLPLPPARPLTPRLPSVRIG